MCFGGLPLTALAIASSVGGGIAQYAEGRAFAQRQAEFQGQLAQNQLEYRNQVAEAANTNFINQSYQENLRQQEEDVQASNEIQQSRLEAARARGRARASAGEAGLQLNGVSVNRQLNDLTRQELRFSNNVNTNREFSRRQSQANLESARANAISQVNNIQLYEPAPVESPGLGSAAFNIIGDAVGTATALNVPQRINTYLKKRKNRKK